MTGFSNVVHGVEGFFERETAEILNLLSPSINELKAYLKAHGKEELQKIAQTGLAAFQATTGTTGDKIKAAVKAAFETAETDAKKLSTQAMTTLISSYVK